MNLSESAVLWLADGERGSSSNTIFQHLTGVSAAGRWGISTPSDPDDLRRCRLLLEQVPEFKEQFAKMKTCSEVWARLVDEWDELCALMDEECEGWPPKFGSSAQLTYKRMKKLGC